MTAEERRVAASREIKHTLNGAIVETGVEAVDDLVEDGGRHLLALLIEKPDLDRPLTLRETLNLRGLVAISNQRIQVSLCARGYLLYSGVYAGKLWTVGACELVGCPLVPTPDAYRISSHLVLSFNRTPFCRVFCGRSGVSIARRR